MTPFDKWIPIAPLLAAMGSMLASIVATGVFVLTWINGRLGKKDRAEIKGVMSEVKKNTDGLAERAEATARVVVYEEVDIAFRTSLVTSR